MPIFHAIVLGLVQGLSEFLPISSSGHLIAVPWLFNWHDFDSASVEKAFDVSLHIGTLFAAVAYFRTDLLRYAREGLRAIRQRPASVDGRLAWLLVLSSIPAAAIGAFFEKSIDEQLGRIPIIAVSLIVFGVVLALADRLAGRRPLESYDRKDSIMIGLAQCLSLNPGTSRSGITITAGRLCGLSRDAAARASFLMALPVTAGAVLYKMAKLAKDGIPPGLLVPMIVGVVTAGLSGFAAVWGTIRLVRTRSFTPFAVYRVAAGVLLLVVYSAR